MGQWRTMANMKVRIKTHCLKRLKDPIRFEGFVPQETQVGLLSVASDCSIAYHCQPFYDAVYDEQHLPCFPALLGSG